MRFVLQRLLLAFPKRGPGPDRHIGNRKEIAGGEFGPGQLPVKHAIKPRHLVAIAVFGIGQVLGRIHRRGVFEKVMRLARHRANATHLPHQPLIHGNSVALYGAIELSGLAGEVLQDRARFKQAYRRAIQPLGIGDRGHAVVGESLRNSGLI